MENLTFLYILAEEAAQHREPSPAKRSPSPRPPRQTSQPRLSTDADRADAPQAAPDGDRDDRAYPTLYL